MSVGHTARILEEKGIATVVIAVQTFEKSLKAMRLPRLLITPHPMGRPLGPPFNRGKQRSIIETALKLLDTSVEGGVISYIHEPYL
ncbi:MAG: hypothetical protein HQ517_02940 [SAR324 cluster bacterium]|nr:hypothetical protein [SAR324 cluster bacterium]